MTNKTYKHQYKLVKFVLTAEDNPYLWTNEKLKEMLQDKVMIGYMFRSKGEQHTVSIYTIEAKYLKTKDRLVTIDNLKSAYLQWLESLIENEKSIVFRNPPIQEWLDTKDEWCRKTARKLSLKYNKTFDDALSAVYFVVMKCYNDGRVYMGNLFYIEQCAHNKIKKNIVYMRNRLTGEHPLVISLDATPSEYNESLGDSTLTFHEIISEEDIGDNTEELRQIIDNAIEGLKQEFSPREIDQILNNRGYLPMPLYRRLLKWRKTHKMEDYL